MIVIVVIIGKVVIYSFHRYRCVRLYRDRYNHCYNECNLDSGFSAECNYHIQETLGWNNWKSN